jgi:hypothetical protein
MRVVSGIVFLVFLLFACTRDVDLEQPHYKSKIVVDGFIETGRAAHVFLTMSSPYLTHYDSASIRDTFLNYGKITLTSSAGEEEVLTIYREKQLFPPFVYKSVAIRGQSGVRYDIKVEVKGRELSASTTIPIALEGTEGRFVEKTDTTGFVEFTAASPVIENKYLFVRVRSHLAEDDFHPAFNPLFVISDVDQVTAWQRVLRSREFGHYLLDADVPYYSSYPRFEYDLRDSVELLVGTVDSTAYKVLESLFVDRTNQENPFAFNGNSVKSNINGGIGRWTGIGIKGVLELAQ